MTDRDNLVLRPTEGERAPTATGERVVVAGAGLALVAGLLIAVINLVGADREAGITATTPTPNAGVDGSPTPRPSRTPRPLGEFTLEPGDPPEASPPSASFFGWIRAVANLVIRSRPAVDAVEIGTLATGGVAFVDNSFADQMPDQPDELGWLHVQAPRSGWVATVAGETELVQRYAVQQAATSGDIWSVVAGGESFVATGSAPWIANTFPGPLAAVSSDGVAWQVAEIPQLHAFGYWTVAWGPAGWLALTLGGPSAREVWVWRSDDGLNWSPLGSAPEATGYVDQIVASDRGYLMTAHNGRGSGAQFWFSADGITWQESTDPGIGRGGWLRVVGTIHGFYAWDESPNASDDARAVFSVDGRTWSGVVGAPEGTNLQIVAVGGRLLGIWHDPESGVPAAWTGVIDGDRLTWHPDVQAAEAFSGAAVSALANDGLRVIAFGWDRATEERILWTLEASGWTRAPLPEEFGGIPRVAAGGEAGFVVVGYRPSLRGPNPVIWHLADDGSWSPEPSPVMPLVPDPTAAECGPAPRDALELVAIDRALAVACFGDASHTVRAWSEPCAGCYGGPGGNGGAEPAWLVSPTVNQLYLSPIEDSQGFAFFNAVIPPSVPYDGSLVNRWVEVTGHFADAASATC